MQKHHTVKSTEKLLSDAINSCPSSASLCVSLKALRTPLRHLNSLTKLDVDTWQTTLNELGNFADDVVALLSRYRPKDEESEQRLDELHASAVNHELDLDARGFLTAFHPSHAHAAHIRNLSAYANIPHDSITQVFHSLPTLLTCVQTLITVPITSNTIENALNSALKASDTGDAFPPPDAVVPKPDYSNYAKLRASVQRYVDRLQLCERSNPHALRIQKILHILMEPGILQEKRLKLYPSLKPFHVPDEVGRSLQTTVYKANTSVYDGDRHLWITKIALKAYPVSHRTESLYDHFHQEALRLRTLSHACLPAFYGYYWPSPENRSSAHASDFDSRPSPRVLLATELMTKDLFEARSLPALRPLKARLHALRDITDALEYLHDKKLYHGRLNPRNILLRMSKETVYGRVKVDVTSLAGRVLLAESRDESPVSSVMYLAPESLRPGPTFFTSDVWSLGIVGCFLMIDDHESFSRMCNGNFARLACGLSIREQTEAWCASIPEERIRSVVENCLHPDPTKRSDSRSVLRSLNHILTEMSETGCPSKMDYTEEVVDGSVVDEIIDSGAIDVDPTINRSTLEEHHSLERERCEQHAQGRPPTTNATCRMQDSPAYISEVNEGSDGQGIRQHPGRRSSPESRHISNLGAMIPEVVDSDSDSKETEDPALQFFLARNLEMGRGVDRDIKKAVVLYRSAHQKGDKRATFQLAQCYLNANGVQKCLTTATHLLRKAAESGHPLAMVELGRLYETGRGVKECRTTSAEWFRRAAESDSAEGMRCYGKCFLEGFGVEQDTSRAIALFCEACKRGDAKASFELAICVRDGVGAKKDIKRACELFRWAAEKGYAEAQLEFANCVYDGIGTDRDLDRAFEMYKLSSDQGDMDACRHLGECYELGHGVKKDVNKAVECFKKASNAGNASAMSSLASCYEQGEGVARDMKKAIQLYKKAERKNDYLALNNLGVMYERGIHMKRDYQKAVKYYKKAKDQGFTEAACNLADCYLRGNGVQKDMNKAIDLYREAAEEGHPGAKCELGNFYYRGLGVPMDCNHAVGLFREACEGEPEASRLLGVAYFAGNGVEQDIDAAVKLFTQAAREGNTEANLNLGLCSMGGCGVPRSLPEAVSLLTAAAEGGIKEAKLLLGNMYYEGRGVQQNIQRAVQLFQEGEDLDLNLI